MHTKKAPLFQEVDPKKSVDEREREIEQFWCESMVFKRSLLSRAHAPRYTFYDGPPFATGTPHYGHLVQSVLKDAIPRYWTMRGKYVERRWGWDCHGLPIENIVEKEMGSKNKKDIEAIGVEEFNKRCRINVLSYTKEWESIISRLGRWADMDDPYRTMDPEYMESVWWVFSQLWEKGLIYENYRSMHVCPRCETTLSQSEVAEGYKDVKDLSVVVKFKVTDNGEWKTDNRENVTIYLLAWTTTPWTLLGNVALAIGKNIQYQIVKRKDEEKHEEYIIAKNRVDAVLGEGQYEVIKTLTGKDFVGLSYEPIFPFATQDENLENRENGWKIYSGDFVTTEEGTGIVHIAPAYGADDMQLGKDHRLPFVQHVELDGVIKEGFGAFSGIDVKPRAKDKPEEVREIDIATLKALKENERYFAHEKYLHSYPHCWRCDTALLNYATTSWFVAVEKIKEKALKEAKDIHWIPEHVKEGRFGKWLEGARDWSISRQRFWASVMPVWKCDSCDRVRVVSNVMEIADHFNGVNRLYLMRHGKAKSNIEGYLDSQGDPDNHLTERGREQVREALEELRDKRVDVIVTSPMLRARETADILAEGLGVEVVEDDRLRETGFGIFNGGSTKPFREKYRGVTLQGENEDGVEPFANILDRIRKSLNDINRKYQGKTIVVVGHQDSLLALEAILKGREKEHEAVMWHAKNAEIRSVFSQSVDLHRPYIDEVVLSCSCGGEMRRIPDVLDTWFDSGSMPYAQLHYPFENSTKFDQDFPADFIGEMVEQTRTWFYYLHVLGVAVRDSRAFTNVVTSGVVLAEDGKKMSKKLKNYPDPSGVMEKYGSDVLRMYLLSSPVVCAENLNFSERELAELSRGMFRMLRNTYSFFVMYANVDGFHPSTMESGQQITDNGEKTAESGERKIESDRGNDAPSSKNVLDRWILSELQVLVQNVNNAMEGYELSRTVRYFAPFIDDLSNWYVRRSRRRFWKSENDEDKAHAYETLYHVLVELSKLLAPFTPFIAEEIFQSLAGYRLQATGLENGVSVHLTDFPQVDESLIDEGLMEEMRQTREVISEGLQIRAREGIKVRQPLSRLRVTGCSLQEEMREIITEELNVKEVVVYEGKKALELDTSITPELKREGQAREIVRTVQAMRKKAGYNVDDRISLGYEGMEEVFEEYGDSIIAKETLSTLSQGKLTGADGEHIQEIDGERVSLYIKRDK